MFVPLQLDVTMDSAVRCSQIICRIYSRPSSLYPSKKLELEFAGLCGWPSQQEVPTFCPTYAAQNGETCNQGNKESLQFHLAFQVNRKSIH